MTAFSRLDSALHESTPESIAAALRYLRKADAVMAALAPMFAAQQPAALAEPLFLLHTGAVYGDERDDWEIEANSGDAVDAYCDANPGKTVGLYLTTPAQQPAAAVPEPMPPVPDSMGLSREQREVEDAFRRGWNSCRARVMQLNAYALAVRNKENNND